MKRAWLLPGERMPVGRPAAPQLRFARIEGWLRELGYEPTIMFGDRLVPRPGFGRATSQTFLDGLSSLVAAPWLAIRAWREKPAVIVSASVLNAHALALIKLLLGDRVSVIVDALGLRSLETEQTTRLAALRRPLRFLWRRLERTAFGVADVVLTVNHRNAELVRSISADARVTTLRDAAEDDLVDTMAASREVYAIPGEAVVVGFMGSIVCSRLDGLLSAWEIVHKHAGRNSHDLHLVVIGDGPDLTDYRELAARDLTGSVSFLGALPRDEALAVLRACDIAYTGSWSQAGFSFKLFEYLALGMPIVVERKPQMEEVLTDGADAVFYDGPSELAEKIELLAGERELRDRIGAAATQTFLGSHTLSTRRGQFETLVRGLEARRKDRIHLLEVGLNCPPETFIGWRLRALADRGVRTTVAGNVRPGQQPPGRDECFEFVRIPFWGDSRGVKLFRVLKNGLPLLVTDPQRLRALVRVVYAQLPSSRRNLLGILGDLDIVLPLARLRPDVVHFDWESDAVRFVQLYAIWNCPVVISCHGAGVNRHPVWTKFDESRVARLPIAFARAAAVHCVADYVARNAVGYGAAPESIWVIRSSVDPSVFAPDGDRDEAAGEPGRPFRVTGVARLIPTKGYEYALSAIRLLVDRGIPVDYEIVGGEPGPWVAEPSDLDRIRYTIEDLGLEPNVRVRGSVSSEEVRDRLRRTDVFLHTSLSDGLATSIAEAMSCEVPVVITDAGGNAELVDDGVEGFVVPQRDPDALADRVEALWADSSLRTRMGRAGRVRVQRDFSLDSLADRFLEMLRSVTQAPNG